MIGFNSGVDRRAVAAIAALDDDVRRALYEFVRAAGEPVSREAAAAGVGISRKLAAFHLDKLVDIGLLTSGFRATPRRVGRAPRLYEPSDVDVAVRVPERSPDLLADILVEALTAHGGEERGTDAALRVARARGAAAGAHARTRTRAGRIGAERAGTLTRAVLAEHGFEPYEERDALRLRNCPFHPLAEREPEFICGLNCEYLRGVIDGIGAAGRLSAELAPRAGECCVEIRPASDPS
jgi:predicted ArsR family transcriptional regulator